MSSKIRFRILSANSMSRGRNVRYCIGIYMLYIGKLLIENRCSWNAVKENVKWVRYHDLSKFSMLWKTTKMKRGIVISKMHCATSTFHKNFFLLLLTKATIKSYEILRQEYGRQQNNIAAFHIDVAEIITNYCRNFINVK